MALRLLANGRALLRRLTVMERLTVGDEGGTLKFDIDTDSGITTGLTYSADGGNVELLNGDVVISYGRVIADAYTGPGQATPAAVTPPTGGATVDSQARTAINAIIAALQNLGAMVGPPFAVANIAGTPGDEEATITWTNPVKDGGSAVTDFEYRIDGGSWTSGGVTESPLVITGLTNDVAVDIEVAAVNSVGRGEVSETVTLTPTAP